MSWTDERIDELTRLWQAGHSASDIGKRMGVSKNAVVGKAHRLKLPSKLPSRPSPIKQGENGEDAQAGGATNGQPAANGNANAASAQNGGANGGGQARKKSGNGARKRSASGGNGKANGAAAANTVVSQRAQLEQRGQRTGCLWPFGDPSEPDFHFCGAQSMPGKPYCQEHAAKAYITRSRDRDERDEEAA